MTGQKKFPGFFQKKKHLALIIVEAILFFASVALGIASLGRPHLLFPGADAVQVVGFYASVVMLSLEVKKPNDAFFLAATLLLLSSASGLVLLPGWRWVWARHFILGLLIKVTLWPVCLLGALWSGWYAHAVCEEEKERSPRR